MDGRVLIQCYKVFSLLFCTISPLLRRARTCLNLLMRFSLDFMLGFLGARLGVGLFMDVIMVPYRYQNKKAFIVYRISSHRHTLYASDNMSEL